MRFGVDDLAGPFPARVVGEVKKLRPAPAKKPAFAWPFGVAAGVLFEVVPGSERNAGGLAGTVVRGVRIATQAEVRDEPRSSWPADLVEWVSLDGLVGLEPKEARAWLELADQWVDEECGTGGKRKRKIEPDLLEAIRRDALAVILEERKRSRRKRKAAAMREIGGVE